MSSFVLFRMGVSCGWKRSSTHYAYCRPCNTRVHIMSRIFTPKSPYSIGLDLLLWILNTHSSHFPSSLTVKHRHCLSFFNVSLKFTSCIGYQEISFSNNRQSIMTTANNGWALYIIIILYLLDLDRSCICLIQSYSLHYIIKWVELSNSILGACIPTLNYGNSVDSHLVEISCLIKGNNSILFHVNISIQNRCRCLHFVWSKLYGCGTSLILQCGDYVIGARRHGNRVYVATMSMVRH